MISYTCAEGMAANVLPTGQGGRRNVTLFFSNGIKTLLWTRLTCGARVAALSLRAAKLANHHICGKTPGQELCGEA